VPAGFRGGSGGSGESAWDRLVASQGGTPGGGGGGVGENAGFFQENPIGRGLGTTIRTVDAPRAVNAAMAAQARRSGVPGLFAYAAPAQAYGMLRSVFDKEDAQQVREDFDKRIGFGEATGLNELEWLPQPLRSVGGFVGDILTDPLLVVGGAPAAGSAAARGAGTGLLRGAMRSAATDPLNMALKSGGRRDLAQAVVQRGADMNIRGVNISRQGMDVAEEVAAGSRLLSEGGRAADDMVYDIVARTADDMAADAVKLTSFDPVQGPVNAFAEEVIGALSQQAGRRGTGAFTKRGLQRTAEQASARLGSQITVDDIKNLLDLDIVFGYGFRAPGKPMGGNRLYLQGLGEWRANVFGAAKLKAADLPWSSTFRQAVNSADNNYNKLYDRVLSGGAQSGAEQIETVLKIVDITHARGKMRGYAHESSLRWVNAAAEADPTVAGRRGPLRGVKINPERNDFIRQEVERLGVDPAYNMRDPLARVVKAELDQTYRDVTAAGAQIPYRQGYLPHIITPEGLRWIQGSDSVVGASVVRPDSPENFMFARDWQVGDKITFKNADGTYREVEITEVPTIDYMNRLFQRELDNPNFKVFQDDVFDIVSGYHGMAAAQIGRQELLARVGQRHINQAVPSVAAIARIRQLAADATNLERKTQLESLATRLEAQNVARQDADNNVFVGSSPKGMRKVAKRVDTEIKTREEAQFAWADEDAAGLEAVHLWNTAQTMDRSGGVYNQIESMLNARKGNRIAQANRLIRQQVALLDPKGELKSRLRSLNSRLSGQRKIETERNRLSKKIQDGKGTHKDLDDFNKLNTRMQQFDEIRTEADSVRRLITEAEDKLKEARARKEKPTGQEAVLQKMKDEYIAARDRFGDLERLQEIRANDNRLAYLYSTRDQIANRLVQLDELLAGVSKPKGNVRFGKSTSTERAKALGEIYRDKSAEIMRLFNDPYWQGKFTNRFAILEVQAQEWDLLSERFGRLSHDFDASLKSFDDARNVAMADKSLQDAFVRYNDEFDLPAEVFADLQQEVNKYRSTLAAWMKGANISDANVQLALRVRDSIRSAQNYWKSWAVGSPGFVSRNIQGGLSNMMILDGVDANSVRTFMNVYRSYARGDVRDAAGNVVTWQERAAAGLARDKRVVREAAERGVSVDEYAMDLIENEFTTSLRVVAATGWGQAPSEVSGSSIAKRRPAAYKLWRADNQYTGTIRDLATHSEAVMRGSHAYHILRNGGDYSNALERVTKFHFNYADIGKLDLTAKTIIPFWMFFSRNLPLQAQMWTSRPARINRTYFNASRNFQDDEAAAQDRPEYFRDMGLIPTGLQSGGNYLHVGVDLPFTRFQTDVQTITPQPWRIFQDSFPWYKLPVELTTNKNLFYNADFRNEHVVRTIGKSGLPAFMPREAPLFLNNPVLRPLFRNLPGFDEIGGELTVTDKAENVMRQIPVVQRAQGLVFPTERDATSWAPRATSFLSGLQVRPNLPRMQEQVAAASRRDTEAQARIDRDRQRALEYVLANRD
jgi:hypothetical protein